MDHIWISVCNWHSLNTNYYFDEVPGSFNSVPDRCMFSQNRPQFKVPSKRLSNEVQIPCQRGIHNDQQTNDGLIIITKCLLTYGTYGLKFTIKTSFCGYAFVFTDFLKEPLRKYIEQFNGLVKLYENEERLGLIQARNRGAEFSTGDVVVFLDAHCECNRNWLVPLLTRINYDR